MVSVEYQWQYLSQILKNISGSSFSSPKFKFDLTTRRFTKVSCLFKSSVKRHFLRKLMLYNFLKRVVDYIYLIWLLCLHWSVVILLFRDNLFTYVLLELSPSLPSEITFCSPMLLPNFNVNNVTSQIIITPSSFKYQTHIFEIWIHIDTHLCIHILFVLSFIITHQYVYLVLLVLILCSLKIYHSP